MRKFKKISFEQFKKDIINDKKIYNEYELPIRSTLTSAGYDFKAISTFELKPGEIKKIPTGVKVQLNNDEFLMIVVRSSMGFKYNVRMCNQIGIIDSDYYNNENNEGHIWIALQNEGNKTYIVNRNDSFAQGIILKYLTVDDEEKIINERIGGLGSTDKGE